MTELLICVFSKKEGYAFLFPFVGVHACSVV